jgi:hypothetical protein
LHTKSSRDEGLESGYGKLWSTTEDEIEELSHSIIESFNH